MSLDKGQQQEQFYYKLLTSTRYDPFLATLSWNNDHNGPCSFFLLPYHFDRLTSAAKTHKWDHITFSYDYLKSTCLDAISKEQQQNGSSSSIAFRVNLFTISFIYYLHFSTAHAFCFFFGIIFFKNNIDSDYTFTRWSNRRVCNSFDNNFHVRSHFTIN